MSILALSLAACAWCIDPPATGHIRTNAPERVADIEQLAWIKVHKWRALYQGNDADGLAAFLSDDFVMTMPDGTISTKAEEVAFLRETGWSGPEDFLYTVTGILFQGEDTAIVYGHGDSTRTDETGAPCAHRYWSNNLLRREAGEWKAGFSAVAGSQCTPLEGE